jgi:hypothetical protein
MPLAFKTQANGDRAASDRRTALRYVIRRNGESFIADIIDCDDINHPVRMATVPLPDTRDLAEIEQHVAAHADRIAKRYKAAKSA